MSGLDRDDIIRMAREAGLADGIELDREIAEFERFANLVAAAERETCAKLISKLANDQDEGEFFRVLIDAAIAIQARGQG